jgi:hypothetical protein
MELLVALPALEYPSRLREPSRQFHVRYLIVQFMKCFLTTVASKEDSSQLSLKSHIIGMHLFLPLFLLVTFAQVCHMRQLVPRHCQENASTVRLPTFG